MKFTVSGPLLYVYREPGDRKYSTSGNGWGSAESKLLYTIKTVLNTIPGIDLIKKRMWKDGHWVGDRQLYLRSRYQSAFPSFVIWNYRYAIECAAAVWNSVGVVELEIIFDLGDTGRTLEMRQLFIATLKDYNLWKEEDDE